MSSVTAVPLLPVKRRILVYLWLGIAAAIGCAALLAGQAPIDPATGFLAANRRHDAQVVQTPSGLQYKVLAPGRGTARPTDEDVALVNYEGKLTNGTTFDKSQQPTPMQVTGVVPGFSEGLKLMTKGSRYRFWIKPSLGYGDRANGPIPAHAVLVFDVEMLDFVPMAVLRQAQLQQQMQQQQTQAGGAPSSPPVTPPPTGTAPPR